MLEACKSADTGVQALRDELGAADKEHREEVMQLKSTISALESSNKDLNMFFGRERLEKNDKE